MNTTHWGRRLLGGAALLLLPAAGAHAVPELQLVPGQYSFAPGSGGGSETITFDVTIEGLDAETLVAAYDFGIIYDPAQLHLTSFVGFTDRLGDPSAFEVYNEDYLGDVNSLWDYRATNTALGDYTGPVLGTPAITGQGEINQGSLRFTQVSYLDRTALLSLQDYSVNTSLVLFTLTFQVDTTSPRTDRIRFVTGLDYAGNGTGGDELDLKLSTETDPHAETPNYPPTTGATVEVPEPATLALTLFGLAAAAARRRACITRLRSSSGVGRASR